MTISERKPQDPAIVCYTIGEHTAYPIPFDFLHKPENLLVYTRSTQGVAKELETGDYSLSLESSVEDVYGALTLTKPTDQGIICICRNVDNSQDTKFDTHTIFSNTMEYAFDKLTALYQDSQFKEYTIHAPNDEEEQSIKEKAFELPIKKLREYGVLTFDKNGDMKLLCGFQGALRQELNEAPDNSFILEKNQRKSAFVTFNADSSVNLMSINEFKYLGGDGIDIIKNIDKSSTVNAVVDEITMKIDNSKIKGNYQKGVGIDVSGNVISAVTADNTITIDASGIKGNYQKGVGIDVSGNVISAVPADNTITIDASGIKGNYQKGIGIDVSGNVISAVTADNTITIDASGIKGNYQKGIGIDVSGNVISAVPADNTITIDASGIKGNYQKGVGIDVSGNVISAVTADNTITIDASGIKGNYQKGVGIDVSGNVISAVTADNTITIDASGIKGNYQKGVGIDVSGNVISAVTADNTITIDASGIKGNYIGESGVNIIGNSVSANVDNKSIVIENSQIKWGYELGHGLKRDGNVISTTGVNINGASVVDFFSGERTIACLQKVPLQWYMWIPDVVKIVEIDDMLVALCALENMETYLMVSYDEGRTWIQKPDAPEKIIDIFSIKLNGKSYLTCLADKYFMINNDFTGFSPIVFRCDDENIYVPTYDFLSKAYSMLSNNWIHDGKVVEAVFCGHLISYDMQHWSKIGVGKSSFLNSEVNIIGHTIVNNCKLGCARQNAIIFVNHSGQLYRFLSPEDPESGDNEVLVEKLSAFGAVTGLQHKNLFVFYLKGQEVGDMIVSITMDDDRRVTAHTIDHSRILSMSFINNNFTFIAETDGFKTFYISTQQPLEEVQFGKTTI